MKCNKKNCPLVGNNENCDIRDCRWRTEDAGEVNAVKEYEDAIFQLEHNKISLGEYESLIEPLKHLYAVKPYTEKMMVNGEEINIDPVSYEVGLTKGMMESQPCKDAISREYALGVIYPSNTYPSRADIYKALKDAPSVTVEPKHGEWIFQECTDEIYGRAYECSICGVAVVGNHHNFCPHCGAKMKGADDE